MSGVLNFVGKRVTDLAQLAGESEAATRGWLRSRGYTVHGNSVRLAAHPAVTEGEIADRIAMAPVSAPCWRCGARQGCSHR